MSLETLERGRAAASVEDNAKVDIEIAVTVSTEQPASQLGIRCGYPVAPKHLDSRTTGLICSNLEARTRRDGDLCRLVRICHGLLNHTDEGAVTKLKMLQVQGEERLTLL